MLARACMCAVYLVGGGLIIEANIPMQEHEDQRGDGAYFREDMVHPNTHACSCMGLFKGRGQSHNRSRCTFLALQPAQNGAHSLKPDNQYAQ